MIYDDVRGLYYLEHFCCSDGGDVNVLTFFNLSGRYLYQEFRPLSSDYVYGDVPLDLDCECGRDYIIDEGTPTSVYTLFIDESGPDAEPEQFYNEGSLSGF